MSNKMMVGCIVNADASSGELYRFIKAPYTRIISDSGDKIKTKLFRIKYDYNDVYDNTMMAEVGVYWFGLPFFLDDALEAKTIKFVEHENALRKATSFAR